MQLNFPSLKRLVILVCFILVLSACGEQKNGTIILPDNSAVETGTSSDVTDVTQAEDTSVKPELGSNAELHTESDSNSDSQAEPDSSITEADAFPSTQPLPFSVEDPTFEEKPFFPTQRITAADLDTRFGQPIQIERTPVQDFFWEERTYDGIKITLSGADNYWYLGAISYQLPDLSYIRDLHVGDSLETVLASFPKEADLDFQQNTDLGFGIVLYGTPQHMQDFGILRYENGLPVDVMYQSEGVGVIFHLDENESVSCIEFIGGLS